MSAGSFADLVTRLKDGDEQAAAQVFDRYVERLAGLVRNRLGTDLRQKIDPEDVTQSAFRSFFRRMKRNQFSLGGWDNLWTVLVALTLQKCGHQIDHFQAKCRDFKREERAVADDSNASWLQLAREPTPHEAAMVAETVERVLRRLKEREGSIFLLGLQGYSALEISARVGRSERTVYRVLGHVKRELESLRRYDG